MARRAGRTVRPVVPVMSLVIAWLAVMVSLPQLMQPDTAAGPGGLALPAVQAYMPDYRPGTTATRPTRAAGPATAGNDAGAAAGTDLAAVQFDADQEADTALEPGGPPAVKLVTVAHRTTPATHPSPALLVAAVPPVTVAAAVEPAAIVPTAIVPTVTVPADTKAARKLDDLKRRLEKLQQKQRLEAASMESRWVDVASFGSKASEDSDGRVARRQARRRHPGRAESA